MIQLPPTPGNSLDKTVSETKATTLERPQVAATEAIKALVLEVKATAKQNYEILLSVSARNNAQPTALLNSSPKLDTITADVIKQLNQGQTLLIKTQSQFPLPLASQLLASVSINKGIVIQAVQPPQSAETVNASLQRLLPQQKGYSELLSNLLLLQKDSRILSSLPKPVQSAMAQLVAALPSEKDLQSSQNLRQVIQQSGLFREANLKQQLVNNPPSEQPSSKDTIAMGPQNITHRLRNIAQKLWSPSEALTNSTRRPETAQQHTAVVNSSQPHIQAATKDENPPKDLKQLLQNLQKALESSPSQAAIKTSQEAGVKSEKNGNADVNLYRNTRSTYNTENEGKDRLAREANRQLVITESTERKPINRAQVYSSVIEPKSKLTEQTATYSSGRKEVPQYLLPPLPGFTQVQIQPRANPSLKGNEMADALVSILLKQVKSTVARVTLNQLASTSSRQETGSNPLQLNLDIPVLHGNHTTVFQFRIEEEPNASAEQAKITEKRWMVQIGFDIEGLGPMLCQIYLWGAKTSVSFWAEWEQTLEQARSHFEYLEEVLQDMGLQVNKIEAHLGIPEVDKTLLQQQLVDIKT